MYCILIIVCRSFLFRMIQNLLPKSTRHTSRVYRINCQLSSCLLKLLKLLQNCWRCDCKTRNHGEPKSRAKVTARKGEKPVYTVVVMLKKCWIKKSVSKNGFVDVNNPNRTNQLSSLSHFNHTYCSTRGKFYLFDHNHKIFFLKLELLTSTQSYNELIMFIKKMSLYCLGIVPSVLLPQVVP